MKSKFLPLALCGIILGGSFAFTSCKKGGDVRVYAPDGAPALALASLLATDRADDGITYTVTTAGKIDTFVTGREPQADVCIMPLNRASRLLGDGSMYQMVGLATHGNLYLLSESETLYTPLNAEDLQGKRIGVVQYADVPGLALRAALHDYGLTYSSDTASADSVYLQGITPTQATVNGGYDLYLVPEPVASARIRGLAAQGHSMYMVGDLQAFFGASGFPQACVVAKKSFIEGNPQKFTQIMDGLAGGEAFLATAEIATLCEAVASHLEAGQNATFSVGNLTREVLARCNVRFEKSGLCRARVDGFLQKMQLVSADSAAQVADDFYYIEG